MRLLLWGLQLFTVVRNMAAQDLTDWKAPSYLKHCHKDVPAPLLTSLFTSNTKLLLLFITSVQNIIFLSSYFFKIYFLARWCIWWWQFVHGDAIRKNLINFYAYTWLTNHINWISLYISCVNSIPSRSSFLNQYLKKYFCRLTTIFHHTVCTLVIDSVDSC